MIGKTDGILISIGRISAFAVFLPKPVIKGTLPKGVTAHSRVNNNGEYVFIQNFTEATAEIQISNDMKNIITNQKIKGNITLMPYDTLILSNGDMTEKRKEKCINRLM